MNRNDNGKISHQKIASREQLPLVKIANKPTLRFARPLLAAAISLIYLAIMGISRPEECFYTKSEPSQPVYNQTAETEHFISIRLLRSL